MFIIAWREMRKKRRDVYDSRKRIPFVRTAFAGGITDFPESVHPPRALLRGGSLRGGHPAQDLLLDHGHEPDALKIGTDFFR